VRHHGKGLFLLTKSKALVEHIKGDYHKADMPDKDKAMLDYVKKLTTSSCDMVRTDVGTLRNAGFKDADILDIAQVTAYYCFVNRLACGLGVELESYWEDE
jgi:uncharacterized peroxidase-related enzyme